jgi:hypothetical protein
MPLSFTLPDGRYGNRGGSRHAQIGSLRALLALRANLIQRQPALNMNGWINPVMVRQALLPVCSKSP